VRTILAGIKALRRTPLAGVPFALEGLLAAVLVATNALPADGGSAPAVAAFPFDIYFDVREALAQGHNWGWFFAIVATSIMFRSLIFSSALWLADGAKSPFAIAWLRGARLAAIAAVALLPSAGMFFTATAIRYAPFVWVAALLGLVPAIVMARRAARLDTGADAPIGKGVPELFAFLSYAYLIALIGYALEVLGREGTVLAALLVACLGPVHAVFFLGWREHVRAETFPGGGFLSTAATVAIVGLLFITAGYDRFLRSPPPVGRASSGGTLLLLGGVDSTSETGALSEFDPRLVGFRDGSTTYLSYRGADQRYSKEDTRGDLVRVSSVVGDQVVDAEPPTYLLGHSQASLIVDRLLLRGGPAPDRSVVLAPSPPQPPPIEVPLPDVDGEGKPGGDFARGFAKVIDLVGLSPFDIDAEASPVRIEGEVALDGPPRVAVWALGDSVWLHDDWRRPGELNVIAITDHVGVTNNARAIDVAKRFFDEKRVNGDEESWRGGLASLIGHAFAPWRPD
jgi:hypothetical protein